MGTHMDDSDKSEPYIGRESDIVLKFRSNKVRECHYFVFGKYYNPLNLAPCRKCNKSGKVPGRMWGKNKCPACNGEKFLINSQILKRPREMQVKWMHLSNLSQRRKESVLVAVTEATIGYIKVMSCIGIVNAYSQ